MKPKYKAIVKWFVNKDKNNKITKWKCLGYYTSNYECKKSIMEKINRKKNTKHPVYAYKIICITVETLEEWEDVFSI